MLPTRKEWIALLEERHGRELQKKISSAVVAVCGLGGLGSNISVALARMGIGKLILIDYDRVDITNIHRQQYVPKQIGMYKTDALHDILSEIAPYVELEKHNVRIEESNARDLLNSACIVCEAFDTAESKAMLVNFVLRDMPDKYIVAASGMAGTERANFIKTRKVTEHFFLCGDEVSDVSDKCLFSSRVMLCAAHQAHAVLRIVTENVQTTNRHI